MNIREWSLPSYAPPRLNDDTTLNSTWHTGWVVLYLDVSSEVLLVHMGTAAVREAPWISLRTPDGVVFFANLVSRETRWIPPRRWMQGWKRRREAMYPELLNADVHPYSHLDASRAADPRISPIPSYTRRMVEGGAPYMHEDGIPQYPPDATDSEDTYPIKYYSEIQARNANFRYDFAKWCTESPDHVTPNTSPCPTLTSASI